MMQYRSPGTSRDGTQNPCFTDDTVFGAARWPLPLSGLMYLMAVRCGATAELAAACDDGATNDTHRSEIAHSQRLGMAQL